VSLPPIVTQLVARFAEHRDAYGAPGYNETQVRREFIDPMFKALGWDMDNEKGFAEQWKEVVHEDAIKVGGATKAPDYSFRLGGRRLFFLEAKKPSVNLKDDPAPAYQLRRYAWTAKMPLSVLTDFEEFVVYDTRVKPAPSDKASTARVLYIRFDEYETRWEEIAGLFSPAAIQRGAYDKYVESTTKKRGTAEVDDAFLAEIEGWRKELAQNIALRNPGLTQRELNFAVQITIDRIVFLRICEDRGVEEYGSLQALLNGTEVYARLRILFDRADERYNSGLFHFSPEKGRSDEPDTLTPRIVIDDKVLKGIFGRLYYPDCPYVFSAMPVEILGQVYEQFLGSVIRLTSGHRAVVERKPEVTQAHGVFYTPAYIVDNIVYHTVGKLLSGMKPGPTGGVSKLRVLDPACGSGSFLLGAFQHLLDWHLEQYVLDTRRWCRGAHPAIFQTQRGEWRLTTSERKRILLNNIYGVDIDPQAVEVTKLSLLLRVLEGESAESLRKQLTLFHERALPDLAANIKCGNSLIGPDFYEGRQCDMFDEEKMTRVNAFDWSAEFREIMEGGGFDAVIGNPPYIRIQTLKGWAPEEVEFYKQRYQAAGQGNYDIYVVFIEKGLSLLNQDGHLGFIAPHKFFNAKYGAPLRTLIARGQNLEHVVHFGDQQVFPRATTYTCLLFLSVQSAQTFGFDQVADLQEWRSTGACSSGMFPAKETSKPEWNFSIGSAPGVLEHVRAVKTTLKDVARIFVGLQTSADCVYVVPPDAPIEEGITKPFLQTGLLTPYSPAVPSARLIFPYAVHGNKARLLTQEQMQRHTRAWDYLTEHRRALTDRDGGKKRRGAWYAFGRSQNLTQMENAKLIVQVTANRPTVLYDDQGLYMTGGGSGPFYGIRPTNEAVPLKYLLGILNSNLFGWVVRSQSTPLRGGYFKFSKQYIETMPIPERPGDFRTERMVVLVDRMLDLHKRMAGTRTDHSKRLFQRQIETTDREINRLVYEIYELTDSEIAFVENTEQEA
jgi:hypothetical protein